MVPLPLELYEVYIEALAEVARRFPFLVIGASPDTWHTTKSDKVVGRIVKKLIGIIK
jgi:hypothetical protein